MNTIVNAFKYKMWADQRMLTAIEQLNKNEAKDGYAFILQQLNHIIIVDELFKARLENKKLPQGDTYSATGIRNMPLS